MQMNQVAGILSSLVIPEMTDVLKKAFNPDNDDILASNASLNLSEGQLYNFACEIVMDYLQYDITNIADNDPAAAKVENRDKYVWETYKGLKAIMYYRIAHQLMDIENNCLVTKTKGSFNTKEDDDLINDYMRMLARKLSEEAAIETTIEINPAACIGKGFVIDHGIDTKIAPVRAEFSTVIGETCEIGENCTLLNSVLLGAAVINQASTGEENVATGKRHPTLGNHVTVCAGVRILGNVHIGDNVMIGPCCVITTDIPDNYFVSIINQLQFSRPDKKQSNPSTEPKPIIDGLTEGDDSTLLLFGANLQNCLLSIVSHKKGKEFEIDDLSVIIKEQEENKIVFCINIEQEKGGERPEHYSLHIWTSFYDYIMHSPHALNDFIRRLTGGAK